MADVPVIHTMTPSSLESVIIAPVACQKRASNGAACMQMRLGSSSSGMLYSSGSSPTSRRMSAMSFTVIEPLRASRSSWARHSRLNAATSSSRASSANNSRKLGLAPLPADREDRSQSSVIWYRFEMAITSFTRRAAQFLPAQFTTQASWRSPIRSPVSKGKLPIIWQLPPWPNAETTSPTASTASSAVAPRSTLSRHRSRQHVPSPSCFWLLNAASLPTATPCSLHASSAPHAQNERPRMTWWVCVACGIVRCVMRASAPSTYSLRGYRTTCSASFTSVSALLASSTEPLSVLFPRAVNESHMVSSFSVVCES